MKKLIVIIISLFITSASFSQEELYLVFEFMKVDNEQETAYWETESFWEKIHAQRTKNGDIIGWDLWTLKPGGESQHFQYLTVTLYNDPVKMFEGSGDLMAAAKQAYPDMSEDDIEKKLNGAAKTRDLAVRIYLKEIAVTKGDFEMAIGTIAQIGMMKAEMNNSWAYEAAEKDTFQPMHQAQVDKGAKGSWGMLRFMSPFGSDTYASHMTVNMFKDTKQMFDESMNYGGADFTEAQNKAISDGIALRDMKYVYVATLVKMAR